MRLTNFSGILGGCGCGCDGTGTGGTGTGTGTGDDAPILDCASDSCCTCLYPNALVGPLQIYYPVWKLVVTGVIDNPEYIGTPCDCSQLNGTFFMVLACDNLCSYASTANIAGAVDAVDNPTSDCISRSEFDGAGCGDDTRYPSWFLSCSNISANLGSYSPVGGGFGPTANVSGAIPGTTCIGGSVADGCCPHSSSRALTDIGYAGQPASAYTPCSGASAIYTLSPYGDFEVCGVSGPRRDLTDVREAAGRTPLPFCQHLGERTEFRAGCASGWGCAHECTIYGKDPRVTAWLDENGPAYRPESETVPSQSCQGCPGYSRRFG